MYSLMLEFRVNQFLSLRLQEGKTYLYVNNKRFYQCIRLILQIPLENAKDYDQINSIDEAAQVHKSLFQNRIMEGNADNISVSITPEEEFRAHCSNIQTWAENNYDTRILHSNISFPLLKQLAKAGDLTAKKVFKEEIGRRYTSGYEPVKNFLIEEGYLNYLNKDELEAIGIKDYEPVKIMKYDFQAWDDLLNVLNDANVQKYLDHLKQKREAVLTVPRGFYRDDRWRRMGGGAVA